MLILARIAIRNLVQARRRTAMLSMAIGLVTMLFVLLMAMSNGIYDNLVDSATVLSAGHVSVAGFYKTTPSQSAPIVTDVDKLKAIVVANVPNLDYVIDRGRGWGKLISPTGDSINSGLSGVEIAQEQHLLDKLQMAKESDYKEGGRDEVIGDPRRLSEPNTAVLFVNQAKRLKVVVGDVITIQTETLGGRSNTADLTVVAVARDVGLLSAFGIFVPKTTIFDLYQENTNTTGALWVYLDDIRDSDATMRHLREVFAKEGYRVMDHESAPFWMKFEGVSGEDWTGQKLDLTTWSDEVSMLMWVITAFNVVTGGLVSVLLVIIVVGIMNSLWNAVRERTREIGTMRAIGMRRWKVATMFLLEGLFLGLFATTSGALAASLIALVVDLLHVPVPIDAMKMILLADTIRLSISPGSLLLAIGTLTGVTAFAALWPAIRASLLKPVTALGHTE